MTANQIEYWKLQETKRHNVATESMDAPLKEAQQKYYGASTILAEEQAKTQDTVRTLNLANAKAAEATAAHQWAAVGTEYSAQARNYAEADYANARKAGQELDNQAAEYRLPVAKFEGEVGQWGYTSTQNASPFEKGFWGGASIITNTFGLKGGDVTRAITSIFK